MLLLTAAVSSSPVQELHTASGRLGMVVLSPKLPCLRAVSNSAPWFQLPFYFMSWPALSV